MLRPYNKFLLQDMKFRVLNIDVLLIKVSIKDGRLLKLHYIGILSIIMAQILKKKHPKWRVGPKISSVNILILNQGGGGPINNIILLRRVLRGCILKHYIIYSA